MFKFQLYSPPYFLQKYLHGEFLNVEYCRCTCCCFSSLQIQFCLNILYKTMVTIVFRLKKRWKLFSFRPADIDNAPTMDTSVSHLVS